MKRIVWVRLENTSKNHNKFYEMRFIRKSEFASGESISYYDVEIRYGRIGRKPRLVNLKGALSQLQRRTWEAFCKQLAKKLEKREYTLVDQEVADKRYKKDIETIQAKYEGFTKKAIEMETWDF